MIDILDRPYFLLFIIMIIGVSLSKINIKGTSLGSSAIILTALVFGHFGHKLPVAIERIGLILFIFSVGIQAGPGFFESFKTGEVRESLIPVGIILFLTTFLTFLFSKIFGFNILTSSGLFAGVMTSTPTLAAIVDAHQSTDPIISYSVSYPISIVVSILGIRLLPVIFKIDFKNEEKNYKQEVEKRYPQIQARHFWVKNPNIHEKGLKELELTRLTNCVISRIQKKEEKEGQIPDIHMKLELGDLLKVIGTSYDLQKVEYIIGPQTEETIAITPKEEIRWILVTRKEVIGKRLVELNLDELWKANISKISRAGIELIPHSYTRLRYGDKVLVTVNSDTAPNLVKMLGGSESKQIDFLTLSLSIVLGLLIGQIKIPMGKLSLSSGISGGILITTLVLGQLGKTGPLLWSIAGGTNQFLRQLGLMFFLCGIGTRTGEHLLSALTLQDGAKMAFLSFAIPLFSIYLTTFLAIKYTKMNRIKIIGSVIAGLTCAPGLQSITEIDKSGITESAYSITYPFALLSTILVGQLLALIS